MPPQSDTTATDSGAAQDRDGTTFSLVPAIPDPPLASVLTVQLVAREVPTGLDPSQPAAGDNNPLSSHDATDPNNPSPMQIEGAGKAPPIGNNNAGTASGAEGEVAAVGVISQREPTPSKKYYLVCGRILLTTSCSFCQYHSSIRPHFHPLVFTLHGP